MTGAAAMTGAAEYDVFGGGFFARGANWSAARALLDACGGGDFFGAGVAGGVGGGAGAWARERVARVTRTGSSVAGAGVDAFDLRARFGGIEKSAVSKEDGTEVELGGR